MNTLTVYDRRCANNWQKYKFHGDPAKVGKVFFNGQDVTKFALVTHGSVNPGVTVAGQIQFRPVNGEWWDGEPRPETHVCEILLGDVMWEAADAYLLASTAFSDLGKAIKQWSEQ